MMLLHNSRITGTHETRMKGENLMKRTIALALAATALTSNVIAFAPHAGKANEVPPVPEVPPAPLASTKGVTEISTTFARPAKSTRGGGPSPYKFDELPAPTVGADGKPVEASFGIIGKSKKSMNSTVHAANKRYRTYLKNPDGTDKMEMKTVKGQQVPTRAFIQDRQFEAFDVQEDGGVTVRIFRTK